MKLHRKITPKRAKEFQQFATISSRFSEIQSSGVLNGITRAESVSDLNFYVVVEYSNVADRISYERIFPRNGVVDYEALIVEQKKLCEHLIRRNCGYPEVFKLLGPVNEVTGCYLVATRKKSIDFISKKGNANTISVKFPQESLPKEVDLICNSYRNNSKFPATEERAEFEKFIKISFEEQDIVLQSVLLNVQLYPVMVSEGILLDKKVDSKQNNTEMQNVNTPIRIEDIASKNVANITSIDLLNTLLKSSLNKENYELCARIRDRILELNGSATNL